MDTNTVNTTLTNFILSGKYFAAVGLLLVICIGLIRIGLIKLSPWFKTKTGGYVVSYVVSFGTLIGTALEQSSPINIQLLMTALSAALISSGVLDHLRDIAGAFQTPAVVTTPKLDVGVTSHGDVVSSPLKMSLVAMTMTMTMIVVACSSCAGVTPSGGSIGNAIIDCVGTSDQSIVAKIESVVTQMAALVAGSDPDKWSKIESLAITDGEQIGGCAFVQVANDWISNKSLTSSKTTAEAQIVRTKFEDYRLRYARGATFRTKIGDM